MTREDRKARDAWAEYQATPDQYTDLADELEETPKFKVFRSLESKRLRARQEATKRRIGDLCTKVSDLQRAAAAVPRLCDTAMITYLRGKLLENRFQLDRLCRLDGQWSVFKELGLGLHQQEVEWLRAENASLVRRIRRLEREHDAQDDAG